MKIEELKNEKLKALEGKYFRDHDWLISPFVEFEEEFESLSRESSAFILVAVTDLNKKDGYIQVKNHGIYSSLDSLADVLPKLIEEIKVEDSFLSFQYDGDGLTLYFCPKEFDKDSFRSTSILCTVVSPDNEIQHLTNCKYEF